LISTNHLRLKRGVGMCRVGRSVGVVSCMRDSGGREVVAAVCESGEEGCEDEEEEEEEDNDEEGGEEAEEGDEEEEEAGDEEENGDQE
jgi:hypothetical protein